MDTMGQVLGTPTKLVIDGTEYTFSQITMAGWLECQDKIKEYQKRDRRERVKELQESLEVVPLSDSEKRVLLQDILSGSNDEDEDGLPVEVVTFMVHKSLLKEHPGITIEKVKKLLDKIELSEVLNVLGLGDTTDTENVTSAKLGSKPSSGGGGG